ncbi:MAG: ATP-binding cassette domain-containing protein [Candidatus Heimdallarchaeota archaeon]|nr:ATP-binding cassette domain-containing protein [Candidatus Heimdallarchaeota archaeon]
MAINANLSKQEIETNNDDDLVPLLVAEDIIKIYQTGKIETQALRGVSFKVKPREKLFLIGPSGSGKTTLVSVVAGITKPTSGKVFWKNLSKDITRSTYEEIIKARRTFAGVIFQDSKLLPHLTVKENIELAGFYAKVKQKVVKQRTEFLLKFLGIWDKRSKREDTLSGGEKKRAAIATTLITNPKILIGDEPTGDLDVETAESILDLFDRINVELGVAICIVTHSQQVAARANRILELRDGVIIGQHGSQISLRKLENSRLLEIDRQSRIVLPKSVLQDMHSPKHFSITTENGKIILHPVYKTDFEPNNMTHVTTCTMCGNLVKNKVKFCDHCGAPITDKGENNGFKK